jgi:hypothetical protein
LSNPLKVSPTGTGQSLKLELLVDELDELILDDEEELDDELELKEEEDSAQITSSYVITKLSILLVSSPSSPLCILRRI